MNYIRSLWNKTTYNIDTVNADIKRYDECKEKINTYEKELAENMKNYNDRRKIYYHIDDHWCLYGIQHGCVRVASKFCPICEINEKSIYNGAHNVKFCSCRNSVKIPKEGKWGYYFYCDTHQLTYETYLFFSN